MPAARLRSAELSSCEKSFSSFDEINLRHWWKRREKRKKEKKTPLANSKDNFNAAGQDGKLKIFWRFVDRSEIRLLQPAISSGYVRICQVDK